MVESKVTDYIIGYLESYGIPAESVSKEVDIPQEKLKAGYRRPLSAEEFLELCIYLGIRPEDVWEAVNKLEHGKNIIKR